MLRDNPLTNTVLVGSGLTLIGVLFVSEGAAAKSRPTTNTLEVVAGLLLTGAGLVTVAAGLRRPRHA